MKPVETDSETGAEIFQLTDGPRPCDNIYGEQPFSSADSSRFAVRYYAEGKSDGGLSILDLGDGSLHPLLETAPRFPAFHAWGDYLYNQVDEGEEIVLRRWSFQTLECEDVFVLPESEDNFSYGTVSQDHRYYAISVRRADTSSFVLRIDLSGGDQRILADSTSQYYKHEQFSLDGRNRILIQANAQDVSVVNLGVLEVDREGFDWLPVDREPTVPCEKDHWPGSGPHTPRCTGHEAWMGQTGRVFLSTGYDEDRQTNVWSASSEDEEPTIVCRTRLRFSHVSVSRCGRYWIGDATKDEDVPLYVGSFESGECKRLVNSRTEHDGKQWSHTHPYFTADNRWLIFTTTRAGRPQVHGAKVPDGFLESL
ncbi:MAG: hypothetical protein QF437_07330 [Planctomycetota bacterium]|jgi:hypothetical protein|nr:hypothetical protein [Planctomycetota bacterium]MDP7130282.1 hypothetical protein [Planctomycetota bacterium]MDP7252939.1 hypothetical protein [Planctomycetota bacterium]